MNSLAGSQALHLMNEISKLPDGNFTIAFFPYSRDKQEASAELCVKKNCRLRTQLPQDKWSINADNLLLFTDGDNNPRTCYRILIRYIGFPTDNYIMHKINWL